jgi:hypothetical protein
MRTDDKAERCACRHQYVRRLHFFCKAIVMKLYVKKLVSKPAQLREHKVREVVFCYLTGFFPADFVDII